MPAPMPRPAAVVLLVPLALPALALAQAGPELLLKPFSRDDQFDLDAEWAIGLPTETGSGADARLDQIRLAGRLRLTPGQSDAGIARAQPRAGFEIASVIFETADPDVPSRLVDAAVGAGMGIFDISGWQGGLTVAYGEANAENQDDANAAYLEANFAVGKTFSNGVDLFGVVVNYDGNRTILPDVPLIGFQYRRQLRDDFVLTLGFPFSGFRYSREDAAGEEWVSVEVNYLPPVNFDALATLRIAGDLDAYASLEGRTLPAHWDALDQGHDRVFFRQNLAEAGISYDADPDRFRFILAGGWAFAQDLETGWDTRNTEELADIEDHAYARVAIELRL